VPNSQSHDTGALTHLGPLTHLGSMPIEEFLRDYWQKRPVLIRQAFPGFTSPVSAEELAGFALEEEVESRLIVETPAAGPLASGWHLEHGPLSEDTFAQVAESHWTLLVQAVDQLNPEVAQLLNRFRFIPNWRLDDIMVSYAADQGSVGPHFDYYDVFLLQGEGKRRWRLGQHCTTATSLRTDTAMNILACFEEQAEYLLEPGDMLYIPPNVAHWGIAEGSCMTYSIGFRAPSHSDLLLDISADIAAELSQDQRYSDAQLSPTEHPGEITADTIKRFQAILGELLLDETRIAQWLGTYGTRPKRTSLEPDDPVHPDANESSSWVALKSPVRAAYTAGAQGKANLYLDGDSYSCSLTMAQQLSSYLPFNSSGFHTSDDQRLLAQLLENHWLIDYDDEWTPEE
jgi:50S ribosomal protein L16 3-hydroxylase